MNEIQTVYGYLLNRFVQSHREADKDKAERIYQAIEVMRELWPEDCSIWDKTFDEKVT